MIDIDIPDIITVDEKDFRLEAYAVHIGETLGLSKYEPIPHYIAVVKLNNEWIEVNDCQ